MPLPATRSTPPRAHVAPPSPPPPSPAPSPPLTERPPAQVVSALLAAQQQRCQQLSALHEDRDGARRDEINAMSGSGVFSNFYDQLKAVREYHRKHQIPVQTENHERALITEVLADASTQQTFTGEEAEGKHLDMHRLHDMYLNVKGIERLDYLGYLNKSTDVLAVPTSVASAHAYARYLRELRAYWVDFLKRTQPLMPLDDLLAKATDEFNARWGEGKVERWQSGKPGGEAETNGVGAIDLAGAPSAASLESHGMDALKAELVRHGLKGGGTLAERAARLFMLKTTPREKLPKALLAKAPKASGSGAPADGHAATALLEEQVVRLGELLADVISETAEAVEKKQARTYEEIERDLAAAADEEELPDADAADDEEVDKPIYNPLNLPLGWDGKPIPYWLYKLHGLNLEFKCEICGNYSYWGPRAYERHFQEWRHSHGMSCLGIPNTKHFHGITLIEDAYTLWAKLKAEQGTKEWNPELDEEFEDKEGNVMNRKTYADLARQGLLD